MFVINLVLRPVGLSSLQRYSSHDRMLIASGTHSPVQAQWVFLIPPHTAWTARGEPASKAAHANLETGWTFMVLSSPLAPSFSFCAFRARATAILSLSRPLG